MQQKGSEHSKQNTRIKVFLGVHNLTNPDEPEKRVLRVTKIRIHKSWNAANTEKFTGDIAILILENNVTFSSHIQPICLSDNLISEAEAVVAGWGRQNEKFGTDRTVSMPKKIEIPIIDKDICYETQPLLAKAGWDKSFCAGRDGVSVCDGDSGSGLYVKINNRFYLRGVVSCSAVKNDCLDDYYAIFSDVTKYLAFIKRN